jgi:hypothetical protein
MSPKPARQLIALAATWTLLAFGTPAFAQVDFSGGWGARLHETTSNAAAGPR